MSGETIEVVIPHKHPASAGMFTFDGKVVEVFGFGTNNSVRLHVRQIGEVELNFEAGVFSAPCLRFGGRAGSTGWTQVIDPREEDRPKLQEFAAAVEAAASDNPEEEA
ncbi:MAG: hypothetical protein JJE10_03470 [Thermoleophilia bacterium]|nr:hypothetical protein [Thermoleophilia bacterium]